VTQPLTSHTATSAPGDGRVFYRPLFSADARLALLVAPLVLFVVVTVLIPVGLFLFRAVDNTDMHDNLPLTASALTGWTIGSGVPDLPVFAALSQDLAKAAANGREARLAQRINQILPGTRNLVIKTARQAAEGAFATGDARQLILTSAPGWSDPKLWSAIANDNARFTAYYLLTSVDLERHADGSIGPVPAKNALFLDILGRTVLISLAVTALCALLALPVAHVIVAAPPRVAVVLVALVLFPLWTSLLVRTVAWIILLQGDGPVNTALLWLGAVSEPLRLVYTRSSLIVTMVQVLLPLMILPILSVLRRISKDYMRAATSLGATWWQAWRRVQLPMIMPGLLTGSGVVFVFALGYYITPALIGGPRDQMLSSFIVFYTDKTLNWGLAAALSIQLLVVLAAATIAILLLRRIFGRMPG
jgi:putative spermidine/putrescine transport system permease protein